MRETYSQVIVDYLLTGEEPKEEDGQWEILAFTTHKATVCSAWADLRDELLPDWIEKRPGTRPHAWWLYDAPRWGRKFGAFWDGTLPEPRLRIGGKGTPAFEALNVVPYFDRGIPRSWVSDFDVSYYNGRAKDIHGNRIGTNFKEGQFPYQAIDVNDPPRFESVAAYLKRHGLFLPGEEKRLPPDAFGPEVIR